VLYRLYLAEKLKEPFRKGSRRPDAALLAARDAARLEADQVRQGGSAFHMGPVSPPMDPAVAYGMVCSNPASDHVTV
jgi:hypothetical protein